MTEHPNETLFRGAVDRWSAGETTPDLFAEDVLYHQIGGPSIHGKDDLLKAMEGFEGVDYTGEVHDVLANDDHTIGLVTSTVKVGDQEFTYRTAEILHLTDGKITERWAFSDDTQAIIDFFASLSDG